jgi:hypothetical protein
MNTIKLCSLVMILYFIFMSNIFAQNNNWQVVLTSGDTLNTCKLDSLPKTILFVSCNDSLKCIPLDSIAVVKRFREGSFLRGGGNGFMYGAGVGGLIGLMSYKEPAPNSWSPNFGPGISGLGGAVIGGGFGFIIGGILGSSNYYEIYDLKKVRTQELKRKILLKAL